MRKYVLLKTLLGNLGVNFLKFDFGSYLYLVRTLLKLQPVKAKLGEVLERLCNGLLLGLLMFATWSAAIVVIACTAASGQGEVFGQRTKKFIKKMEIMRKKLKR